MRANKLTIWNECQKAAAILDKELPGWYDKVDTDTLMMNTADYCIRGQLGWCNTSSLVGLDIAANISAEYTKETQDYWVRLINKRKEST